MIEINLLKQLVTFAENGSLTKASEVLFISQSALSRSMIKLEKELGFTIFTKSKNKLTLNDTGLYMVDAAKKIIEYENETINTVRLYDKSKRTIFIGSCAPFPLSELTSSIFSSYEEFSVSSDLKNNQEELVSKLKDGNYSLIILNHKLEDDELMSIKFSNEKLYIYLDNNNPLAKKDGIYLSDLNNVDVLVYSKIGFWYELLINKAPNINILEQNDTNTFNTLINTTLIPSFATDKTIPMKKVSKYKKFIPILDEEATVDYYCVCLKKDYKKYSDLFRSI